VAKQAVADENAAKNKLLGQAETYLRLMHKLSQTLARELVPMLEERYQIDLRLAVILQYIEGGVAQHPSALAQELYLPKSIITRHLDQLVALGLLQRSIDPEDSRRIKLILTREGLRLARDASSTIFSIVARRLERITPAQRETLLSIFTDLADETS
jgi:DNA-binding MarR family transcriptional regulator